MSWAEGPWPRAQHISHVAPPESTGREPDTTIVDWWTDPPHAFTTDECRELVELARTVEAVPSGNGLYYPLDGALDQGARDAIVSRIADANERWWRLDLDTWYMAVKRYRTGEQHRQHQDWVPGTSACRKLVGGWQLSPAEDYTGGDVVVTYGPYRLTVPRDLGTFYALPCWTVHEVEPVTAGARWALIVNGYGLPLR